MTDTKLLWALKAARLLVGALSFVVAVNLAILLYARTVTRLGEIAVRTALGASRGRILSQLFVEALALTGLGAGAGLGLGTLALRLRAVAGARQWRLAVLDSVRALSRQRGRTWRRWRSLRR